MIRFCHPMPKSTNCVQIICIYWPPSLTLYRKEKIYLCSIWQLLQLLDEFWNTEKKFAIRNILKYQLKTLRDHKTSLSYLCQDCKLGMRANWQKCGVGYVTLWFMDINSWLLTRCCNIIPLNVKPIFALLNVLPYCIHIWIPCPQFAPLPSKQPWLYCIFSTYKWLASSQKLLHYILTEQGGFWGTIREDIAWES